MLMQTDLYRRLVSEAEGYGFNSRRVHHFSAAVDKLRKNPAKKIRDKPLRF